MARRKPGPIVRDDIAALMHKTYADRAANAAPASAQDWRRDHIGASVIGHECSRYLWLTYHWVAPPNFDGRELRLLNTGQIEETRIHSDLMNAGFDVDICPPGGGQYRFRCGQFGGSIDGYVRGFGGTLFDRPMGLECKTSNANGFDRVREHGVLDAKPLHWWQMQSYMGGLAIDSFLYVVTNKDTDDLYVEEVPKAVGTWEQTVDWARGAVEGDLPPVRDPEYAPCVLTSKDGTKWPCQFYNVCHGEQIPERNCRTCVHVRTSFDGGVSCMVKGHSLTPNEQRKGCDAYKLAPIANAKVVEVTESAITYQFPSGAIHRSGADR